MSIFITILVFLVVFSILILIHECGHFFAAKHVGVKVEEFGFGLPPRLWGKKKGDTLYSINWIPFGGFVRMLGEDSISKRSKGSKQSFTNQTLRSQAFIVLGGVFMNLLLAYILLTVGFTVGIEPLISNEEDFLEEIYAGTVNMEPGIVVVESNAPYQTVDYNGEKLSLRSFEPGDRILTGANGEPIEWIEDWTALLKAVQAGKEKPLVEVDRADGFGGAEYLTAELLDQTVFAPIYLPRLVYKEYEDSVFSGFLQDGDVLIRLDDQEILSEEHLYSALWGKEVLSLELYRLGVGDLTLVFYNTVSYPLITYLDPESPAALGGLLPGDQILSLNSIPVHTAKDLSTLTARLALQGAIHYEIQREDEILSFTLVPRVEDGRVGIAVVDLLPSYGNLSLYPNYIPHTLMGVKTVQYGWSSPLVAFTEMGRLSKITAVMFVNVLKEFLTGGKVPEGVSGPVGIAQMTFFTVQAGFAATLRFVALLSLSLGVINILPVPALDGGKFFFILVQAITGKKLNEKYESLIHAAGFFFLILFLIYVTFNDVVNLF